MTETVFPFPSRIEQKSKKKKMMIIGIVALVIVVVGFFLLTRPSGKSGENKETISPTQEPAPTDRPEIEKSSVKIQIQNGTGTPGQAGTVVKVLEDAGFSPDNIKTGNADEYDTLTTTITSREEFGDIARVIKDELKSTFDEIDISSTNLGSDSEFDIVIVTGGELFEESSSSSSSTTSSSSSSSSSVAPSPTLTPSPTPTP